MRGVFLSCVLITSAGIAAAQEDDRGYLTAFLEDNLSSAGRKVTITGFAGALSSQATVQRIEISDDKASGSRLTAWCWTGAGLRCWRAGSR